jgi:hypothetical protein
MFPTAALVSPIKENKKERSLGREKKNTINLIDLNPIIWGDI